MPVRMPLRSPWRWYASLLKRRPLLSQSLSAGTIMAFGDVTAQLLATSPAVGGDRRSWALSEVEINGSRTFRYFLFSSLLLGPALRGWYVLLARAFDSAPRGRLKMLLADQLLMSPVTWVTFLGYSAVAVRGLREPAAVRQFVLERLPTMAKNSYSLWPPVQAVNFFLVPLHLRVVFVSFVGYFWNTYICWLSASSMRPAGSER